MRDHSSLHFPSFSSVSGSVCRAHKIPVICTTPPHPTKMDKEIETHLLKLKGWPPGPVRTVIPEVPVEPAALGAGLGWLAGWDSVLCSIVVLMAAQSPCVALEVGDGGIYAIPGDMGSRCDVPCDVRYAVCDGGVYYSREKRAGHCHRNATRSGKGKEKVPEQEGRRISKVCTESR